LIRSRAIGLAVAVALLAGCDQASALLPSGQLECAGTEPELCRAIAALAVAQMDLDATGPITLVALTEGDCEPAAMANFRSELAEAQRCWDVRVTGERSHGWGVVGLWPNGDLRAFW
jgi:hypothetical protein